MPADVAIVAMDGQFPNCENFEEFEEKIFSNKSLIREWTDLDQYENRFRSRVSGYITLEESEIEEVKSKKIEDFPECYLDLSGEIPTVYQLTSGIGSIWSMRSSLRLIEKAGWETDEVQSERTAVLIAPSSSMNKITRQAFYNFFTLNCQSKQIGSHLIDRCMSYSESANVSCLIKNKGITESISSACASGLGNIGYGYRLIQSGIQDRAIVGGVEATSMETFLGFDAMRMVLSRDLPPEESSRPFDINRNGFVCSFGCGLIALENLELAKARGANILGVIRAYSNNSDGDGDMFSPSYDGKMRLFDLLMNSENKLPIPDVVKAHGTSTKVGDAVELFSIVERMGDSGYHISAPKSQHGHLLNATGAVEVIISTLMLQKQMVSPCLNADTLNEDLERIQKDPKWEGIKEPMAAFRDLIPTRAIKKDIESIVCLNYGFGGANTALYITKE